MNNPTIEISAPKFDLYELVTLNLNEQEQHTKVVRHWFDYEGDLWWYKIQGSEALYPENALTATSP